MTKFNNEWEINEFLLQMYRLIFILSQTIFLVLAVIVWVIFPFWVYVLVMVIALALIWVVWFPIVRARALVVDYYKIQANMEPEHIMNLQIGRNEYVNNRKKRAALNLAGGMSSNWRRTRQKLDFGIPFAYSFIWVLFLITGIVY